MAPIIAKPNRLNHYQYVNQLLGLRTNIGPETPLKPKDKDDLKDMLLEKHDEIATTLQRLKADQQAGRKINVEYMKDLQENLNKIHAARNTLLDDKARQKYNEDLAAEAARTRVDFSSRDSKKGIEIIPTVPITKLVEEFKAFAQEQPNINKPGSSEKYAQGDFKYTTQKGPPVVHIFTFPDQASANRFLQQLFDKKMATLPGGSTNLADINPLPVKADPEQSAPARLQPVTPVHTAAAGLSPLAGAAEERPSSPAYKGPQT